ncbi:unnamed protein product [Trichogramma brassicae]|uniref:Uncharacterized protein n=1 Tax=Trichogramma brassicae TaxID=86971 RepID=A0A6H5IRS7_9HYME|nr:unnamed protein product [Trichogramma brassicae]
MHSVFLHIYSERIKTTAISTFIHFAVFINYEEAVFLTRPTLAAQFFEAIKGHIAYRSKCSSSVATPASRSWRKSHSSTARGGSTSSSPGSIQDNFEKNRMQNSTLRNRGVVYLERVSVCIDTSARLTTASVTYTIFHYRVQKVDFKIFPHGVARRRALESFDLGRYFNCELGQTTKILASSFHHHSLLLTFQLPTRPPGGSGAQYHKKKSCPQEKRSSSEY